MNGWGEVKPEFAPGIPRGWYTWNCLLCGGSLGVVVPGPTAMFAVAGGVVREPNGKLFSLSHIAHRECVMVTPKLARMAHQQLAAAHMLAELIELMN